MSRVFDDNTANFLSATNIAAYNITADFTFSCWVKRTTTGNYGGLLMKSSGGSTDYQVYFTANDAPWVYSDNTVATTVHCTTNLSSTGVWYHLAFTKSGTTWTWYVNGTAAGTGTYSTSAFSNNATGLTIGKTNDASIGAWNGLIAYPMLNNVALSGANITTLQTSINPQSVGSGCVGCWKLDTTGDLTDSSGNGNTLTVNGTVAFSTDNPLLLPLPKRGRMMNQSVARAAHY